MCPVPPIPRVRIATVLMTGPYLLIQARGPWTSVRVLQQTRIVSPAIAGLSWLIVQGPCMYACIILTRLLIRIRSIPRNVITVFVRTLHLQSLVLWPPPVKVDFRKCPLILLEKFQKILLLRQQPLSRLLFAVQVLGAGHIPVLQGLLGMSMRVYLLLVLQGKFLLPVVRQVSIIQEAVAPQALCVMEGLVKRRSK